MGRVSGFYGKLPARGDFVRAGLPGGVVDALDGWMRACIVASQDALGDGWFECWMEAPVWQFFCAIAGDVWGGVWMPSMDRAERCFPLVILTDAAQAGPAWREGAEQAGFEAITGDVTPDRLALRLAGVVADVCPVPVGERWWTVGAPRKAAVEVLCDGLPDPAGFASYLTDHAA